MYIGNNEIMYVDKKRYLRIVDIKKIYIEKIRRADLTLESFSYLYEKKLLPLLKWKFLRKIFPKKLDFNDVVFVSYLLNEVHILIKLDYKKVTYEDLLFSVKLKDIKEG
ncbi:MAG: hypothetical protein QXM07_09570 [Nitrososphaerota archaeon]